MKTLLAYSKSKDYLIHIDKNITSLIKEHLDNTRKYFVFYDEKIDFKNIDKCLEDFNIIGKCPLKGGENSKTIKAYTKIIDLLLDKKVSKKDCLIVVGGGTLTDLIGYVASTYKRGVDYINIPSTTLAMIDASVGGKNALNVQGIKNVIGTIYPPTSVLIGLDLLKTLPKRQLNNGLCEAIKMALLFDEELFNVFKKSDYIKQIEDIITKCLEYKISIVKDDEFENGKRKWLNYGHTFGHAIEAVYKGRILHGEAIIMGIQIVDKSAFFIDDLKKICAKLKIKFNIGDININNLIDYIKNDKKGYSDCIDLIKIKKIGEPIIEQHQINKLIEEFS